MGAIGLKNSVYVLPLSDSATEDFQWIRREIVEGGGDATVLEAQLAEGLSDAEVEAKFQEAKEAEYVALIQAARAVRMGAGRRRKKGLAEDERDSARSEIARLKRHAEEAAITDFFRAPSGAVLRTLLADLEITLDGPKTGAKKAGAALPLPGRTWVTRTGIHIDRIACAWLIRRFIDPEARLKFVAAKSYAHQRGELRFDMFEAEYSHQGEHCSFETLRAAFKLNEPGLQAIAEIVHDIDIKDGKFHRPETEGVAACIAGICRVHREDEVRLMHGSALFDGLLAHLAAGGRS